MHSKATNIAVYSELGVLPLVLEVAVDTVKFWLHTIKAETSSVLYDCYQYQVSVVQEEKCWLSTVKDILTTLGFEEVWYNQTVQNEKCFIRQLKDVIHQRFVTQLKGQM